MDLKKILPELSDSSGSEDDPIAVDEKDSNYDNKDKHENHKK